MYPTSSDTVPSRSMKIARPRPTLSLMQNLARRTADGVGGDPCHASMIDWAFPKHARTAFDRLFNHSCVWSPRSGDNVVRCPEHRNSRHTQRCSHMHWAGVVCEHEGRSGAVSYTHLRA